MSKGNNMSRDSKTVVATANQINYQHKLAISCAETAIEHAIMCGQMLVDKKASLAHGEFQGWIEKNCEFAYSTAARYMKAAQSSEAVNLSSLRHIFPSGKPSQKPKQSPAIAAPQISSAGDFCDKTAAEKEPFSPAEEPKKTTSRATKNEPSEPTQEACRGGTEDLEKWGPEDDEAAQLKQAEKDYAASIDKVMGADDKLAAAHDEIKRQAAEIATLKLSRNQYQNQCAELIKKVKSLQRQLDKRNGSAQSVPYEH